MEPMHKDFLELCNELIAIGAEVSALMNSARHVDQHALLQRIDNVNLFR